MSLSSRTQRAAAAAAKAPNKNSKGAVAAPAQAAFYTKPHSASAPRRSARNHYAFFKSVYGQSGDERKEVGIAPFGSVARVRPHETEISKAAHTLALFHSQFAQQPPTAADDAAARLQWMLLKEEAELGHVHRLAFHGDDLSQGIPDEEMSFRTARIRETAGKRLAEEFSTSRSGSPPTGSSGMFDYEFAQAEYPSEPNRTVGSSRKTRR